ncbi:MAG: hypothetical protein AB4372_34345 [Xenococcus sp. (in: cyanobacteria)]
MVIVHEKSDLSDAPRFLLTDALHWDASRVFNTWSYRWPVETFHEFSKQLVGFESAHLRNEEAVKRKRLSFEVEARRGNLDMGTSTVEVSSKACLSSNGDTPRHFCISQ